MAGQRLNLQRVDNICGKRRFHDLVDARAFTRILAGKNQVTGRGKPGLPLGLYWCKACAAFHAGAQAVISSSSSATSGDHRGWSRRFARARGHTLC